MLEAHINAIEKVLIAQSAAARNAAHPNLRGGPREWFIREFLLNHLPTNLETGQGDIIDENSRPPKKGEYRPQVDIMIYRVDFPKITYAHDHFSYLAEGVIATIESKSKITKAELKKACKACNVHKSLTRNPPLNSFGNPPEKIISYVVAYDGPKKISTVAKWLPRISNELGVPEEQLVDMIIVLGKGAVWKANEFIVIQDQVPEGHNWAYFDQIDGNLLLMFMHFMTWMSSTISPPEIFGYVSDVALKRFDTI